MRTSFHHQPEAQHPNFPLSTSRQADYPIFPGQSGQHMFGVKISPFDPKRTSTDFKSRSAAVYPPHLPLFPEETCLCLHNFNLPLLSIQRL